jgi:PRTRC genetic system protein B
MNITSPPDAFGAIYILPGQYLFKRIEEGQEKVKALSSGQIALAFREVENDSGWLNRRILRFRESPEGSYILSYQPAGVSSIFIQNKAGEVSEIRLPLPTLVLFGNGDEFYVWAAKKRVVRSDTKLSIAPLPNIGGDLNGKICFGKTEVPPANISEIDAVWNLFWNTPFNGDSSNSKCKSEPKDVRKLLFRLSEQKAKRFPASELIESDTTVEDLWMRVAR